MGEALFRLRINYQKQGRLSFLSHLEITCSLERTVRRAGLPYAVSQGFNAHMRYVCGPALPVGTQGLDEYFDVLLNEYVEPEEALDALQGVSAQEQNILGVCYVDPKAKGLQATHVHEEYRVLLSKVDLEASEVQVRLDELIGTGELKVQKKGGSKVYDLSSAIEGSPLVEKGPQGSSLVVSMRLKATQQGSIRPEALIRAALGEALTDCALTVTRVSLGSDED